MDQLLATCYYRESGGLISELAHCLPHSGHVFKNDNSVVFMEIEEAASGSSVEATIKSFSCRKHRRGFFQYLIRDYAGEVNHRVIPKKRLNILQNIKCNAWVCHLERHVYNHRQHHEDPLECSTHMEWTVPGLEQTV